MKGKTKTYSLLVTVLAVWGVIGFKVLSTINPEVPDALSENFKVSFNPKETTKVDTFSIQTTNRDPFLGHLYKKMIPKVKTKRNKPKEVLVWQPITYHGAVSKQDKKAQIFVISINQQQHLMKVGQEVNEIKLIKANNKTVLVRYKGETKTIEKL